MVFCDEQVKKRLFSLGRPYALSIGRRIDVDDAFAIYPSGELLLSLTKDTFMSTGFSTDNKHSRHRNATFETKALDLAPSCTYSYCWRSILSMFSALLLCLTGMFPIFVVHNSGINRPHFREGACSSQLRTAIKHYWAIDLLPSMGTSCRHQGQCHSGYSAERGERSKTRLSCHASPPQQRAQNTPQSPSPHH